MMVSHIESDDEVGVIGTGTVRLPSVFHVFPLENSNFNLFLRCSLRKCR